MTQPDTSISKEQWLMARCLNIMPGTEKECLDVIDKLLDIEKHKGREAAMREISRMMGGV